MWQDLKIYDWTKAMRVGDLVRIAPSLSDFDEVTEQLVGCNGIVVLDHSPMRPPDVGRVVDVLWDSGSVEDMYTHELEVISEGR